jgi:hypothetical protein
MELWKKLSNVADSFKSPMLTADGKTLTNVNPHEAVRRMTDIFGPCGTGWGFDAGEFSDLGDIVQVKVTVWYRPHLVDEKTGADIVAKVSAWGGTVRCKGDSDLFKKAVTNGFSKAVSYLGYASEVYLNAAPTCEPVREPVQPAAPDPAPAEAPDPTNWQPLADAYRKAKLPDYGVRYRWRVKGSKMSFWTDKVPNGAWNILKAAGFKVHAGPHGGKVVYLLVPLDAVKKHCAAVLPVEAAASGLPPLADAQAHHPVQ